MIALEQVHKRFAAAHAVRGVSLEIPSGSVVGILGPNGAGKSTTIRMITAAIPPTSGRVTLDGLDTVDDSARVRSRIGYLPEANPLYPDMRTRGYLRYRARLAGVGAKARSRAIDAAMDRCMLAEVARQRIGTLSKGFRQRVGLAATLLHDPPVLVLDEPTSGLDPQQIAQTRSLIRELAGERTMLLVSHILPEVERTCSRIIVFARGRVRADGSPEELLTRGGTRYVVETSPALPETIAALPGVEAVVREEASGGFTRCTLSVRDGADPRTAIAELVRTSGVTLRELRRETESLERFYLRTIHDADADEPAPPQTPTTPVSPASAEEGGA